MAVAEGVGAPNPLELKQATQRKNDRTHNMAQMDAKRAGFMLLQAYSESSTYPVSPVASIVTIGFAVEILHICVILSGTDRRFSACLYFHFNLRNMVL